MRTFKCGLLFFTAALFQDIGSAAAKSLAAWSVGIPNTLYHVFNVFDGPVGTRESVLIALAPEALSLLVGVVAAWASERVQSAAASILSLYLTAFAAISVLGSLMMTPWSGPFHGVALVLGVPAVVQVSFSITATLVLVLILWHVGARLQPPVGTLVVPLVVATIARAIVLAPMPAPMIVMLVGGTVYWLVAIAGGVWGRRAGGSAKSLGPVRLWMSAWVLPVLLILVVRLMAMGVRFE